MRSLWRVKYGLKIHDVGKNLFLFMFNNNEDRAKVLKVGPWNFDKHIPLLEKLEEETHFTFVSLYKALFLVKVFFGDPYLCLSERVGRITRESIGALEEIGGYRETNNSHYLRLRLRYVIPSVEGSSLRLDLRKKKVG
ncbi:DUF4283 domain-containing protein [Cephalotus follicularis]|uniref:DUF4283 domain-containing protein n=1 Tax=Cephalotus follicularis TaxID=3775 RepID=A0A1Q3B990_CEPFO|nr:DUF4283 domain-containing protein [Cephalotus follicularis]